MGTTAMLDNQAIVAANSLMGHIFSVVSVVRDLPWPSITQAVEVLHRARLQGARVFVCGNGGSAATASHFVNDLNKGAIVPGMPRFRAIGLTDNTPLLTAWSNDESYVDALAEALTNLAEAGDVLVAISCSGTSRNIIKAVRHALDMGMTVIGLTGHPGGDLAKLADSVIQVPCGCTEQIEDVHMILTHAAVVALRELAVQELGTSEGTMEAVNLPLPDYLDKSA